MLIEILNYTKMFKNEFDIKKDYIKYYMILIKNINNYI